MQEIQITNAGQFTADYMKQIYEFYNFSDKKVYKCIIAVMVLCFLLFPFFQYLYCYIYFGLLSSEPVGLENIAELLIRFIPAGIFAVVILSIYISRKRARNIAYDDIKEYRLKRILLYPGDFVYNVDEGNLRYGTIKKCKPFRIKIKETNDKLYGRDPGYDRYLQNFHRPMEITYLVNAKIIMLIEFPKTPDDVVIASDEKIQNSDFSKSSDVQNEDEMSKDHLFANYLFVTSEIKKSDTVKVVLLFFMIYADISFIVRSFNFYASGNGSIYMSLGMFLSFVGIALVLLFINNVKRQINYNKTAREDIEKNRVKEIYLTPSDFSCNEAWLDKLIHKDCRMFTLRLMNKKKLFGREPELNSYFNKFKRPIQVIYLEKSGMIMLIK